MFNNIPISRHISNCLYGFLLFSLIRMKHMRTQTRNVFKQCPDTIWSLCEHKVQIRCICAYHSSCGWQWSSFPILKLLKLDNRHPGKSTLMKKNDYSVKNNTSQWQPILTSHYILQVIVCMLPFTCRCVWGCLKLCRILLFFPLFIV